MSRIHKTLISKYEGDLELPSSPLSFEDPCSNKLKQLITNEDKVLKEVKNAVENGNPLDKFGAYFKTFQRDIHLREGLLFNDNNLIVSAALRSQFMSLLRNTSRKVRHESIGRKCLVAASVQRNLHLREKLHSMSKSR